MSMFLLSIMTTFTEESISKLWVIKIIILTLAMFLFFFNNKRKMDPTKPLIPNKNGILNRGIFRPDGHTILFQLIVLFVLGIVLAPYSGGLLFIISLALIFEIIFAAQINFKYDTKILLFRFSLFAIAFLGFIIRRAIHGDTNSHRGIYHKHTPIYKLCNSCTNEKEITKRDELKQLREKNKMN